LIDRVRMCVLSERGKRWVELVYLAVREAKHIASHSGTCKAQAVDPCSS
jgi:hypothetical protein